MLFSSPGDTRLPWNPRIEVFQVSHVKPRGPLSRSFSHWLLILDGFNHVGVR
nr:MAG: hypothetical protein H1Rhizo27585_000002 [Mitovirus sp.]